ncbi:hypothetical protein ACRCUN_19375 [Mycobacterium sp. LTG2003]
MNALNDTAKVTAAFFLQAAIACVRLDEARMEKLIAEHNPFSG